MSKNSQININEIILSLNNSRFDVALRKAVSSINHEPKNANLWNLLAITLAKLGRFQEAEKGFCTAIEINPLFHEFYFNLACTYMDRAKYGDALSDLKKSLVLKPNEPDAYNNLGIAQKYSAELLSALSNFMRATLLKIDFADAFFNRSLLELAFDNFRDGWQNYEWRWKTKLFQADKRSFNKPLWTGEQNIAGKVLLVHAEQGLGDTIQFSRYIPLLEAKGATVLFSPQGSLRRLLQSQFSTCKFVTSLDDDVRYDFHCPLLSLPKCFKTSLSSIPNTIPYLKPDKKIRALWRKKLSSAEKKVGLCWRGNDSGAIKGRSVPLSLFHDISRLPGCRFISLQKGSVQDEIIRANVKMENFEGELDKGPDAFLDTGAIISLCDLVITIDTSIAHLAGAMGARTWLILKKVPDWRWGLLSDRSPWYPNLTLYRESELLGWMNVLEKIKSDLSNL